MREIKYARKFFRAKISTNKVEIDFVSYFNFHLYALYSLTSVGFFTGARGYQPKKIEVKLLALVWKTGSHAFPLHPWSEPKQEIRPKKRTTGGPVNWKSLEQL